ncbi:MAG: sugar transferase [Anaerolineales bacterium]|nr:sugar transferase [Anaerolineales bacterium]
MDTVASTVKRIARPRPAPALARAKPLLARRLQWRLFILSLLMVDLVLIGAAFRVAYLVRFELPLHVFAEDSSAPAYFYQALVAVQTGIWLIVFAAAGLYNRHKLLGGTEEYALVFRSSTTSVLAVVVVGFLVPSMVIARAWLVMSWVLSVVLVGFGRFVMRRVVYLLRRRGWFLSPAVIVGANLEGLSLAKQLLAWTTSGLQVVGFLDEKLPAGTPVTESLETLGSVSDIDAIIREHEIEEVILASSAYSARDHLMQLFQRYGVSKNVNLRMSSGLYEIITTGLSVREFAYVPLIGVNKVRLTGTEQAIKLLLDYAVALPGLILLSPLLLLLAVAVRLDSPGPVIYRRRVMGINGRQFDALKLRTMHVNGDEILSSRPDLQAELARNHKLKDDPRLTRLGPLLRRLSLDELPQLFNVLRREMSLVGPRMISPAEMEKYDQWSMNLLTVPPGITGVWQVSGRSNITYDERVQLDMYYIRNWSIWLDLQLLWQTIPAVLRGTGAY